MGLFYHLLTEISGHRDFRFSTIVLLVIHEQDHHPR
jgi:hypothetical protein